MWSQEELTSFDLENSALFDHWGLPKVTNIRVAFSLLKLFLLASGGTERQKLTI